MKYSKAWACALAVAAGCGGDDGNKTPDAGHTVDAPDGGSQTMTIHGTATRHAITDSGETMAPQDLTAVTFASYSSASGPLVRADGAGAADGTFTVPVATGATSWEIEEKSGNFANLIAGNTTAPDFGFYQLGRLDGAPTDLATAVTLAVTGMSAWGAQDTFQIVSPNAGAVVFSPEAYAETPPVAGDVQFSGVYDWSYQVMPLIEAAKGDITYLVQLVTKGTGATAYAAAAKIGTAADFTIVGGQLATLTATLAAIPQTETFALHWKRTQFEALKAQVGPNATTGAGGSQFFAIDALPGATAHGFYATAPDLMLFYPSGTSDLDATFTYGNPYATGGTAWDEFAIVGYYFNVPVQAGTAAAYQESGGVYSYVPLASITGGNLVPTLSPVRNIKVGGKDVTGAPQTGVGTSPTVTWDAPTTGTATSYVVQLHLVTAGTQGTTVRTTATFHTKGTSLQIPATYIAAGATYDLVVSAEAAGYDPSVAPLQSSLPYASAVAVTAAFQP